MLDTVRELNPAMNSFVRSFQVAEGSQDPVYAIGDCKRSNLLHLPKFFDHPMGQEECCVLLLQTSAGRFVQPTLNHFASTEFFRVRATPKKKPQFLSAGFKALVNV